MTPFMIAHPQGTMLADVSADISTIRIFVQVRL